MAIYCVFCRNNAKNDKYQVWVIQCDSLVKSHCYETKFVCLKGRISSRLVSNRLWIGCQTHLVYPVCDPARQSLYFHSLFLVSTISFSYTLTTAREACETAVGLLMCNVILKFMCIFGLSRDLGWKPRRNHILNRQNLSIIMDYLELTFRLILSVPKNIKLHHFPIHNILYNIL